MLALGLMLGLMLAATHVSLAEYVDHSLRSIEDVSRHLDVRVLGVITDFPSQYDEVRKRLGDKALSPDFRHPRILGMPLSTFGMAIFILASASLITLVVVFRPRLSVQSLMERVSSKAVREDPSPVAPAAQAESAATESEPAESPAEETTAAEPPAVEETDEDDGGVAFSSVDFLPPFEGDGAKGTDQQRVETLR
jgi:hypothetical protein